MTGTPRGRGPAGSPPQEHRVQPQPQGGPQQASGREGKTNPTVVREPVGSAGHLTTGHNEPI